MSIEKFDHQQHLNAAMLSELEFVQSAVSLRRSLSAIPWYKIRLRRNLKRAIENELSSAGQQRRNALIYGELYALTVTQESVGDDDE